MRKRISKQKELKLEGLRGCSKQGAYVQRASPILTVELLLRKTDCLQSLLKFEKERIERIVAGASIDSIRFQEVEKNCCFQEFLKRYHSFQEIKHAFTGLIRRHSLAPGITFMDFKLKNFIIMNNYAQQLKRINSTKDKHDTNETASRSTINRHFKEMEINVKRMTRKNATKKNKSTHSASFVNLLTKNIEKMRKNNRQTHSKQAQQMDFKPILTSKAFLETGNRPFEMERLHTTPDPQGFDAYGLEQFRDKNYKKLEQISQLSHIQYYQLPRSNLNTEKSQETLRYQTEYDTEKIQNKKSKSKQKQMSGFKKSTSKSKSTSKGKQSLLMKAFQGQKK